MNISEGDTLVKKHDKGTVQYEHEYTVKTVENGYIELENGDYVSITEIEQDVKHGVTRVIS